MMVVREYYLKTLRMFKDKRIIKVITGRRISLRSGVEFK